MKKINANILTARLISTGEIIQAIGYDDSSDNINFSFGKDQLSTALNIRLMDLENFPFSYSGTSYYVETEVYHIVGIYDDLEIKTETIEIV